MRQDTIRTETVMKTLPAKAHQVNETKRKTKKALRATRAQTATIKEEKRIRRRLKTQTVTITRNQDKRVRRRLVLNKIVKAMKVIIKQNLKLKHLKEETQFQNLTPTTTRKTTPRSRRTLRR